MQDANRRDPPPPRRGRRPAPARRSASRSTASVRRSAAWNRCESRSRPRSLGTASEPAAREMRTGDVGEADEAMLVVVRGAIVASARRSSSGTVSFEIDDGSGPLRISIAEPRCVPTAIRSALAPGSRCAEWSARRPADRSRTRGTESGPAPHRRCGSPRRSPAERLGRRPGVELRRARVRRSTPVADRLARRPRDRGPLTTSDRRDPRRRSVEGDAGRRAALGRRAPGRRPPVVRLARRPTDARASSALRARPRRPPGRGIRAR